MKKSTSLLLCAALATPAAWAETVTVQFGGKITSTFTVAPASVLATQIHAGDSFTGQFSYDTATAPSQQTATFEQYVTGDFVLRIGSFVEQTHAAQISVTNSRTFDSFYVAEPMPTGGFPRVMSPIFVNWSDSSGQALNSTGLPTASAWPLPGFGSRTVGGDQREAGGDFLFFGDITSVTTAAAVDEPEGIALMLAGLAGLAAVKRRLSTRATA